MKRYTRTAYKATIFDGRESVRRIIYTDRHGEDYVRKIGGFRPLDDYRARGYSVCVWYTNPINRFCYRA